MNKVKVIGHTAVFLGQTFVWFQTNSQLVWDWWKDKPVIAALFSLWLIALSFWYGTKYIYEATGELWTARYVAFGISYLIFPFLTYYFLGESIFTAKTMVCTGLAIIIVCIQFFWK